MSVRDRRLLADHQQVLHHFGANETIRLVETEGTPPERYRFEYRVTSLAVRSSEVVQKLSHTVEVYLPLSYPRQAPQCRMLTPVFHPNIAPHAICVGDHWAAGESLASLIARIAEMLTFQSYNIKSPLNGDAARWAVEHMDQLPLDNRDFTLDPSARPRAPVTPPPSPVTPPPAPVPEPVAGPVGPLERAQSHLQVGDARAALDELRRLVFDEQENVEALRLRGVARAKLGDLTGAAKDYERVLALQPDHPRADWLYRYVKEHGD